MIASCYCYAQTKILYYPEGSTDKNAIYSLKATVTSDTPPECSISCNSAPQKTSDLDVEIPSTVNINGNDYTVTKITGGFGSSNFKGSLILPSTIKTIGKSAFENSGFTGHLVLPEGASIGMKAFAGCDGFTAITISANMDLNPSGSGGAFGNSKNQWPSNVTNIICLTIEIPSKVQDFIDFVLGKGGVINKPTNPDLFPIFSPTEGSYTDSQYVTISCNDSTATIYYTTNGTTPTSSSTRYQGPITVAETKTIKAVAIKASGENTSQESAQATFTILNTISTPTFEDVSGNSLASGIYYNTFSVYISCLTDDVTIKYTTDGTDPKVYGTKFSQPIEISKETTIRAIAQKGDSWSGEAIAEYHFHAAKPEFNITTDANFNHETNYFEYNSTIDVTIRSATEGSKIHYSVNGSEFQSVDNPVTIEISESSTIEAYTVKDNYENSETVYATYTEELKLHTPVFKLASETTTTKTIELTCEDADAKIMYSYDRITWHEYNNVDKITINEGMTIHAYATKTNYTDSNITEASYTFNVPAPVFEMTDNGESKTIKLSCEVPEASIKYSYGNNNWYDYDINNKITISENKTVYAYATKTNWTDSDITSESYTFKVNEVISEIECQDGFAPNNQFYNAATVTLTCTTTDAIIYYSKGTTIDNTPNPIVADEYKYNGPIDIDRTTLIKAFAYRENWDSSELLELWCIQFESVEQPEITLVEQEEQESYSEPINVKISCVTKDATIIYTINGEEAETTNSEITIKNIFETTTIEAYGIKEGINNSVPNIKTYTFKVPAPVFKMTDNGESKTIELSCKVPEASIKYSYDNNNWYDYDINNKITISENKTVYAYATKTNWTNSDITSESYTFKLPNPTFNVKANNDTFDSETNMFENGSTIIIIMECQTNGSEICYSVTTSDGTTTGKANSGCEIEINKTSRVEAYAVKEGWDNSESVSILYTRKEIVQAPTVNIVEETDTSKNIEISSTDGTKIYYRFTEEQPWSEYIQAIEITSNTTVYAYAVKDNWTDSPISSNSYTFELPVPIFTPESNDLYTGTIEVEIKCTEADAIYYTTGSDYNSTPTPDPSQENGQWFEYGDKISLNSDLTFKAIAYKEGWNESHVATKSYSFVPKVSAPVITPAPNESGYNMNVTVKDIKITCETEGATIRYTLDGSTPDTKNDAYTKSFSITINNTKVVKAIAYKDGMQPSEITAATYSLNTDNLYIFRGGGSGDPKAWSNANNWNTNRVPNSTNANVTVYGDLEIQSGDRVEVEYISQGEGAQITVKDGGQLIYQRNILTRINVEKEITGYGDKINDKTNWYLISTPIADNISNNYTNLITGNDVNVNGTPDYDLYLYDEATHYWINYKDNKFTNLSLGHGYLYANRNNVTITSVGIPNTNDVNFILSAACPNTSDEPVLHDIDMKGFNLIGNPFTFNIGKGTNQAISNTYLEFGYYTLSTTDGTWVPAQDSRPIGVGEGILVETANDGNDGAILTISKTPYVATSKTRSASEETESLSIKVVNENYEDIAYVNFNNEKRGLRKIAHMNEDAQMVYVPANGVNYAIANMNTDVKEIPVSFVASTMGKYTISIDASKCNFEEIYLRDNFTGETVDIINEDYAFVATSSDKAERFTLLIANNNANEDSDIINQNFAYIHNGEIIISDVEGSGNVYVYDIMGRPVLTRHANGNVNIPASSLTGGIYIISLIDDNGIKTQKIAINK